MVMKINNVVLSYPHLFEPYSGGPGDNGQPQKAKYSATFHLDKASQADLIKAVIGKIKECAATTWPIQPGKKQFLPPSDKLCLRDGDQANDEEVEGKWTLKASEISKPYVVDQQRRPLASEDDKMYPGAIVNLVVRFWGQDNKFGKRVNANLIGVQFVKDGERLAGVSRPQLEDAFDMVDGGDYGDDMSGNDDDPFA
jgi:hypothetical protein